MAYLMGVDLGTSSVKAMVMDEQGNEKGLAARKYGVSIPRPGWAEQDAPMWWDNAAQAICESIAKAGVPSSEIAAVGFSGQMHGFVPVDKNGLPVRPAIIWQDQRTADTLEEIYTILGRDFLAGRTQNALAAGFALASLYWLMKNEPESYERTETILLPKDYLKFRLTGNFATDYSDAAATLMFDNYSLRWADEVLLLLGMDPDKLPPLFPSIEQIGTVHAQAAAETGLSVGTPIINGGADQAMQAIGNGIVADGVFCTNIGTGGQVSTSMTEPAFDEKLRTLTFAHAIPGRWYIMGATLAAGASLQWLAQNVLETDDFAALDKGAENIAPGSGGLVFLPYLSGERTPHVDANARAVFFGMNLGHTRYHMARAVMEGVAFSFRDCLEIITALELPCDRMIASGGGASSALWMQIQADVLQKDMYRSLSSQQACLGAAITAGVGVGLYPTIQSACANIVAMSNEPVRPRDNAARMYDELWPVYRALYANDKDLFTNLSRLS